MDRIRHTLVSDGPTDANLIPIIDWCLKSICGVPTSEGRRAEFHCLREMPRTLDQRLSSAIDLFPCNILFVHRDAERQQPDARFDEIRDAYGRLPQHQRIPVVGIVPVRMLEAWFCFDERAVRLAAGNPTGLTRLQLPALNRVESCPNPKAELNNALVEASEHTGRRLKKFKTAGAFSRIVDFIDDFSPLRQLPAFRRFESSIRRLKENDWNAGFYD